MNETDDAKPMTQADIIYRRREAFNKHQMTPWMKSMAPNPWDWLHNQIFDMELYSPGGRFQFHDYTCERSDNPDLLAYGRAGWQIVAVLPYPAAPLTQERYTFFLQREIPTGDKADDST